MISGSIKIIYDPRILEYNQSACCKDSDTTIHRILIIFPQHFSPSISHHIRQPLRPVSDPGQYPVRFQVPLHLPFEQQLRNQKDISLQFDPDVEDLTQIPQHKELKRSDPPFHQHHGKGTTTASKEQTPIATGERKADSGHQSQAEQEQQQDPVVEYEYDEDYSSEADESEQGNPTLDSVKSNTNSEFVIAKNASPGKTGEDRYQKEHGTAVSRSDSERTNTNPSANSFSSNRVTSNKSSSSSSNSGSSVSSNDRSSKKLPSGGGGGTVTTSNTSRFIINNEHHKSSSSSPPRVQPSARVGVSPVTPGHPKVIVTTSTSIRDNHGRTINYSITSNGGSISSTAASTPSQPGTTVRPKPGTVKGYDEYKESDVLSDPFYLDVPRHRTRTRRSLRNVGSTGSRRKRYILLVPRFM